MPEANTYVWVVTEIWHRKPGAVGKLFAGRKPTRNAAPVRLNLRLTFTPITGKRCERRTDRCDRLPTSAVAGWSLPPRECGSQLQKTRRRAQFSCFERGLGLRTGRD
jgi:hypothetical protein